MDTLKLNVHDGRKLLPVKLELINYFRYSALSFNVDHLHLEETIANQKSTILAKFQFLLAFYAIFIVEYFDGLLFVGFHILKELVYITILNCIDVKLIGSPK